MFVKSNNPIKIYQVPWRNSPNTEEPLRDTEVMLQNKEIAKIPMSTLGNNPGTAKTFPAVIQLKFPSGIPEGKKHKSDIIGHHNHLTPYCTYYSLTQDIIMEHKLF